MSFIPPLSAPILTRAEMKDANERLAPLAKDLRRDHARWRERIFIRHLTGAENVVLSAVISRTLGWTKLIDVIPLSEFMYGLRDQRGEPVMSEGWPAFLGTGLDKKTVAKALVGLEYKGMIARFSFPSGGRETYAYIPTSAWVLRELVARRPHLGTLPWAVEAAVRVDEDGDPITTDLEDLFLAACNREPVELANPLDWFKTQRSPGGNPPPVRGKSSPGQGEILPRSGVVPPPVRGTNYPPNR